MIPFSETDEGKNAADELKAVKNTERCAETCIKVTMPEDGDPVGSIQRDGMAAAVGGGRVPSRSMSDRLWGMRQSIWPRSEKSAAQQKFPLNVIDDVNQASRNMSSPVDKLQSTVNSSSSISSVGRRVFGPIMPGWPLIKGDGSNTLSSRLPKINIKSKRKRIYSVDCNVNLLRLIFTEMVDDDGTAADRAPATNFDYIGSDNANNECFKLPEDCEPTPSEVHQIARAVQKLQSDERERRQQTTSYRAFVLFVCLCSLCIFFAFKIIWNAQFVFKQLKDEEKICYNNDSICWF